MIEDIAVQVADIDGLRIQWDARVLQPRPWTAEQGRWTAEIAQHAPGGPILELCCGAGQIGLVAARLAGRALVQVDRDPVATGHARHNAAAAGITADVRTADLAEALRPDEAFWLALVDPPWVTTDHVGDFPEDPVGAIDGGPDGMAVIRESLRVGLDHLHPGGHLVLQVGGPAQVDEIAVGLRRDWPELEAMGQVEDVRDCRPGGMLVHLVRAAS